MFYLISTILAQYHVQYSNQDLVAYIYIFFLADLFRCVFSHIHASLPITLCFTACIKKVNALQRYFSDFKEFQSNLFKQHSSKYF